MIKPKVIVVVGPTATNKTKLAILLAQKFNGEIISADAFQVYKQLNVGVNKPNATQLKSIKFHFVNNINVDQKWDIKLFQDEANKVIVTLLNKNKTPIVVGGSHLYIDALIKNYDLSSFDKRSHQYEEFTNQELYEQLKKFDKVKADTIINNRQRLVRALQIYANTSDISIPPMKKIKETPYDTLLIACMNERELIYQAIDKRVDEMINSGWQDEIKELSNKYKNIIHMNAFKAIGYLDIYQSLINKTPMDIKKIKQKTRHYAKRQITWIKHHYENPLIFNQTNESAIITKVKSWLNQ